MRKLILAAMPLLCLLIVAGCSASTSENVTTIQDIPKDARLLYTNSEGANGTGVKTDLFENPDDVGFFVVEILQRSGEIKKLRLETADGGAVASFGDVEQDAVFLTDLVTDAAGSYVLHFGNMKQFDGEINVYFVAGIGYSFEE